MEICTLHANQIERICLDKNCNDRLMCLLCQHQHGEFKSIFIKTSESYSRFKNVVNEAIDLFIQTMQGSEESKLQELQASLIQDYYHALQKAMLQFIQHLKDKNIKILKSNRQELLDAFKDTRITGNHTKVAPQIFKMYMEVYQGQTFSDLIQSQNQLHSEEAHSMLTDLHLSITKIMDQHNFKSKLTAPDLRKITIAKPQQKKLFDFASANQYMSENHKVTLITRLKFQSSHEFNSVISDALMLKETILVTSYDKHLRIYNKQLKNIQEIEFNNVLTKVEQVDAEENVYAIAQSKELIVQKLTENDIDGGSKQIMKLRGHSERINDIHAYNTRILGSSSDQGTKIWDLYKEKCEYTFKDEANPTAFSFLPQISSVAIGYNNHTVKSYSIQTLKSVRKWVLDGVPLFISQEKQNSDVFFVCGFSSNLAIIDCRLKKLALNYDFKSEAVTCLSESIFQLDEVVLGERGGLVRLFDLRTVNTRHQWQAHEGKSSASKPNGVVRVFEHGLNSYLTVGAIQRKLRVWEVKQE